MLERIRASVLADGGDVELVGITNDGVVRVRLLGQWSRCPFTRVALKNGVENALREVMDGGVRVEIVSPDDATDASAPDEPAPTWLPR